MDQNAGDVGQLIEYPAYRKPGVPSSRAWNKARGDAAMNVCHLRMGEAMLGHIVSLGYMTLSTP